MKSSSREQQYVLLFQLELESRYTSNSSVALRPFEAWSYHSKNIPLSIVASTLFPLAYVACHRRDAWEEPLLRYALLLYGVAVAIMALLSETGPRRLHGRIRDRKIDFGCVLPMASCAAPEAGRGRLVTFRAMSGSPVPQILSVERVRSCWDGSNPQVSMRLTVACRQGVARTGRGRVGGGRVAGRGVRLM